MKMEKTNELSRRLGWKVEEKDNENQKLIKKEQICILVKVIIKELEVDIIEKIRITREKNKKVIRVVKKMKKIEVKTLREDK